MAEHIMHGDDGGGRQRGLPVDYPANSKKAKEEAERPKVEKVVTGVVTEKKRSLGGQVIHDFVQQDAPQVFSYLVMDVFVPAAKNFITDFVSQGVERMLYGDQRPSRAARRGMMPPGYTNYSTTTRAAPADPRPLLSRQQRATHDFNSIVLDTRVDADNIIDGLRELISQYQQATVFELYGLLGLTPDFVDNKWGWTDLRTASVRGVRNGWQLFLPPPEPLV